MCLYEKLEINSYKGNYLLNNKLELIKKYRHLKNILYNVIIARVAIFFMFKFLHNVPTNVAS